MYSGWTEYVVLWTDVLGFIWDIKKRFYCVYWEQSRPSKSWMWVVLISESVFLLLNNDDKKCEQNFTANQLGTGWENKN